MLDKSSDPFVPPVQSKIENQKPKIIFSAAHSGFFASVPLGGGAAIANVLALEWRRTRPFDFLLLGPGDSEAPDITYHRVDIPERLRNLTSLTERRYADFCFLFGSATTEFILHRATQSPVCVLSNDISEGPGFERLAAHSIPVVTIFHVDVVDYFCRFYLRGIQPERMTRWYEALRRRGAHRFVPRLLKLVFDKQRSAVTYSHRLVVPSRPMKEIILRCYPQVPDDRVVVIPWGGIADETFSEEAIASEKHRISNELQLTASDTVLVTLGRISPEKGIERLLDALLMLELGDASIEASVDPERSLTRDCKIHLLVCGDAAYMRGARYLRTLKRRAAQLRGVKVHFAGHVTGIRKQALLRLADLYVHPSIHESYGLTIVEAMRAGLPVLTTDHYSARDVVDDSCGVVVPMGSTNVPDVHRRSQGADIGYLDPFATALADLLRDRARLSAMGERARQRAATMQFSDSAAIIAELLTGPFPPPK